MKPQKLRRILAGGLGLLLVVLLLFLWNGTAGNPISALIATRNITAYVKETYPGANFSVENAHYNFKTGGYSCFVTSPISEDTAFSIDYAGTAMNRRWGTGFPPTAAWMGSWTA